MCFFFPRRLNFFKKICRFIGAKKERTLTFILNLHFFSVPFVWQKQRKQQSATTAGSRLKQKIIFSEFNKKCVFNLWWSFFGGVALGEWIIISWMKKMVVYWLVLKKKIKIWLGDEECQVIYFFAHSTQWLFWCQKACSFLDVFFSLFSRFQTPCFPAFVLSHVAPG